MGAKLTYATIPNEIKQIANSSLGLGVLKSLFSHAYTYHLMIKVSDGIIVGFALYHFQNTKQRNGEIFVTGVIDCVCVDTPYRREGFGTLLTFGTLRKMSAYGADRIEIVLKTPRIQDDDGGPGVPLAGNDKLLKCMGFRKERVIDKAYEQKSLKYGYDCIFCSNSPDTCKGVLYAIHSTT